MQDFSTQQDDINDLKVVIPARIFEKYSIDREHFHANEKMYQISYKEKKKGLFKVFKIKRK